MSEFSKTIIVVILSAVIGNGLTATKVSSDIENLEKVVVKIEQRLDRIDDRTRQLEIKQATYLAAN